MHRILFLWGPPLAYMAAIFGLSSRSDIPGGQLESDKLAHGIAYALLAVLVSRALHGGLGRVSPGRAVGTLAVTIGYGAVDEIHQYWVPGRHASLADFGADALGAVLAMLALALVARPRRAERAPVGRR